MVFWVGAQHQDTYNDINTISSLQTYYNGIPNGSFVAFATQDAIFPIKIQWLHIKIS